MVKKLQTHLVHGDEVTTQRYFRTSKEFYDTALFHLEAWNKHNEDLSKLRCLLLDKVPIRQHFDNVIDLPFLECEVLTVKPEELMMNTLSYAVI
jgi:hypothetical protein